MILLLCWEHNHSFSQCATMRLYFQNDLYIQDVTLAHQFEGMVVADDRFEIVGKVVMGLVCFRLKVCAHLLRNAQQNCRLLRSQHTSIVWLDTSILSKRQIVFNA